MKKLYTTGAVLSILLLTAMLSSTVFAGSAYDASFTTSITYQNVGSAATTTLVATFQSDSSSATTSKTLDNLAAGASSSIYLGNVTEVTAGFTGSAVLSSDQPIVATLVQVSSDSEVVNRPLSNGFSSGTDTALIASLLKAKFSQSSKFSVQNVDSVAADITIKIYDADNPTATPVTLTITALPAGAAKFYDMGTISEITASSFSGSAVATSVQTGTSTAGKVVASVMELSTSGGGASAFEGIPAGGSTLYMPSALCNAFGGQTSYYALQNTSLSATANVTVTYSSSQSLNTTISPGAKASIAGCTTLSAGTSGAATITSDQAIIGIQKVAGTGVSAATPGANVGVEKLALPYVRWTEGQWTTGGRQRTFIAIQNVGGAIAASGVTVEYINKDGAVVGIHTLAAMAVGEKLNSTPANATVQTGFTQADLDEFGYVGGFGGAAVAKGPSGSNLVAVARVASRTDSGLVAEDYNGVTAP